jgi:hypothetical protein
MRKTSLSCLALSLVLGLALAGIVKAESYGPPAGIPSGMPDFSNIPGGMPDLSNIPGGAPAGVNMGPSVDQLEKMNAAQAKGEEMQRKGEEMQKAGEAKALGKMRGAIPQFEKAVKLFKDQVAKLNKKGAPTTERMRIELDKLDAYIVKIKATTNLEELGSLFEQFGDLADSAQEALQNMSKASKFSQVDKQAKSLLAKLKKESVNLKNKAIKKGLADELATNFADFDKAIADQEAALTAMETLVKTDPDVVFDEQVGPFFDGIRDIYENYVREISASLDLKSAVKTQLPKFVNSLEARVKSLAKNKKINVTGLKGMVDEAKVKLAEIKKLTAGKTVDMEATINAIDDLTNISPQFEDKWEEITGKGVNSYEPTKLLQPDKKDEVKIPANLNAYMNKAK